MAKKQKRKTLQGLSALEGSFGGILYLLAGADFRAAHGGAKKWGKDAEVKQPGQQRYETDHGNDNAAETVYENAQGDQYNTCHETCDAASRGSHKLYEGVHFISPIW
jgi:hypothetical protein